MNLFVLYLRTQSVTGVAIFLFWFVIQQSSLSHDFFKMIHNICFWFRHTFYLYNFYLKNHLLVLINICVLLPTFSLFFCLLICLSVFRVYICFHYQSINSLLWTVCPCLQYFSALNVTANILPFHNEFLRALQESRSLHGRNIYGPISIHFAKITLSINYRYKLICITVNCITDKMYKFTGYTVCPRSSYPFCIVSYYMKWVTTSWTHSMYTANLYLSRCSTDLRTLSMQSSDQSCSGKWEQKGLYYHYSLFSRHTRTLVLILNFWS